MNKISLIVVVLIAVCGCATKNINKEFSFSDNNQTGLVIGSVTQDWKKGANWANTFYYIESNDESNKQYRIEVRKERMGGFGYGYQASEFPDMNGRIFAIELPVGTYSLYSWRVKNGTGAYINPKEPPPAISFEVKHGEVLYLGNVHMHMDTGKNFVGFSITAGALPEIKNKSERDLAAFRKNFPNLNDKKINIYPIKAGYWFNDIESVQDVNLQPVH